MYPFSDSTGSLVWLSSFSILTEINVEYSILFLGLFLGFLGPLGLLILSRVLNLNFKTSYLAAIVMSSAPLFTDYTLWNFTPRGLAVSLIPFVLSLFFILFINFDYIRRKKVFLRLFF